jgi:PqqD family protein of HPr-rel-A system
MPAARFVADPESCVRSVALDGLSVLFHLPSGMTHIVAPPAPQILEALRLGPADAGEILARMRAWYDLEGDEAADAVEARLEELEEAGLVSRLESPVLTSGRDADPLQP